MILIRLAGSTVRLFRELFLIVTNARYWPIADTRIILGRKSSNFSPDSPVTTQGGHTLAV